MNAFTKTFWSFAYVILLSACVDQTDDKSASVNNVVAENEDQKKSMAGAEILVDLPDSGLEETPWTTLEALDSQAKFHFAVVTDRTGGERVGPWANAMDKLNLLRPCFFYSTCSRDLCLRFFGTHTIALHPKRDTYDREDDSFRFER